MASLPIIYTIQASDAPQHTDKLREILQKLKTESRIKGFTTLGVDDDLSSMSDKLKKDDMILILLTNELKEKGEQVKKRVNTLKSNQPGLRIAEILVDNVVFDNDFITFPDDLRPIRNREDMDDAWSSIARSLRDMFPVKKKKKAKPFPQWILFVVLGVLLFGALLIIIMPTASGEETEETFTTVPDLAGMNGSDAILLLINTGLETGERSVESHDTVEKDLVIRTEPNAGESIKKGAQVNLILSSGREQVRVPDLAGVTLDRARAVLEEAGLRVGQERSERSDQIEQGRVIRSDPLTGREVDRGSQVNLVISSGREQVQVPDLAGMTLDRARAVLEEAGLRVGQQQLVMSNNVSGRVIRTEPTAGSDADRGSQINLVASLGSRESVYGQQITITDISPDSPAALNFNDQVDIQFDYRFRVQNGVRIFIRPFTSGNLTPNYAASGSPVYNGSGRGSANFTIRSGNVTVDQLRIQVLNVTQNELLFEFFIPVEFTFLPKP